MENSTSRVRVFALIAFVTLLACITACASASIQATRDPSFSGRFARVFVLLNHGEVDALDADYTPALVAALKNEFSNAHVQVDVQAVNALALSNSAYAQRAAAFKPDGLLFMNTSGGVKSAYGGIDTIIYDVSLVAAEHPDRRVWRAQVTASGGTAVIEKKMRYAAEQVVSRLRTDKLID